MEILKQQMAKKEIVETLINGSALTLITFGVQQITLGNYEGYLMTIFGFFLEFTKYKGRKMKLWK